MYNFFRFLDMIICPTCSAVLRRLDGLHQPDEPYLQNDGEASFMVCLMCGAKLRWKEDDDVTDLDFGDGAIA